MGHPARAVHKPSQVQLLSNFDMGILLSSTFHEYQIYFLTLARQSLALVQSSVRGLLSKLLSLPNQTTRGSSNVHGLYKMLITGQDYMKAMDEKDRHISKATSAKRQPFRAQITTQTTQKRNGLGSSKDILNSLPSCCLNLRCATCNAKPPVISQNCATAQIDTTTTARA
jgi:hypothetical protein